MKLPRKISALFRRRKLDADMAEEMRLHLERRVEENVASGMNADEARYAALRVFGGMEQAKEMAREQRAAAWLGHAARDFRFALRQLAKSPGFTTVSVLSLGLGIGASTAVFSGVNAILLRALPVPDPQALREVRWSGREMRIPSIEGESTVSPPVFLGVREAVAPHADVFGFAPLENAVIRARGEAFSAKGALVSDNFFPGLGLPPFIGHWFAPGTDFGRAEVVLSYALWEKQFSSDPDVLGQTLSLNGTPFTVIGVLPRGFNGVQPAQPAAFYVPLAPGSPFLYVPFDSRFHWFVRLMARLKPGASDATVQAALGVALTREIGDVMQQPQARLAPGRGGWSDDRGDHRSALALLGGIIALVMVVACANLAGLSLARGAVRQHELAVRAALGANRRRLVFSALTESLLLALLGTGLGIPVALWLRAGLVQWLARSHAGLNYDVSLDLPVLGFTAGIALVAALLSGLLPAWRAGQVDPLGGLKQRGALSVPRLRIGRVLVATQIGLSVLLLTGAGLFARTLLNLASIDAGFRTDNLLLFQLNLSGSRAANAQPAEFYGRVQAALASIPGVEGTSLMGFPLLQGESSSGSFDSVSGLPGTSGTTRRLRVGETFFSTLGIPLVQGRDFSATDDAGARKVIVVNEAFVQRYLAGRNPLGLTLKMWEAEWEIVGVSRNAKFNALKPSPPPTAYFPFRQMFYSRYRDTHLRSAWFAVRTTASPLPLVPTVRRIVASLDADVPLTQISTQSELRDHGMRQETVFAALSSALAALAMVLSCIGLYGLMAYNVARRTSEIGIRLTLGASGKDISRAVLREAMGLSALGIGAGLPAAFALSRLIGGQLYGVRPNDPATLAAVTATLVAVTVLAAWLPARRAANVDPMVALRAE